MIRIVKMEFEKEKVEEFLLLFKEYYPIISSFEGCSHLELLQDENQSNIFFTYSIWKDESYLNKYRDSEIFGLVWSKTKPLFNTKAAAWSVNKKYPN